MNKEKFWLLVLLLALIVDRYPLAKAKLNLSSTLNLVLPSKPRLPIFSRQSLTPLENCSLSTTKTLTFNRAGGQNNKFGLYIYASGDNYIEKATTLINSQGGDWGYVTIPIDLQDLNWEVWHDLFTALDEKHLTPIVQLFNLKPSDQKPFLMREEQTTRVAVFLNALPWPIKKRYISVYNEPNDSRFWWGRANAKEYAEVLDLTIRTFKNFSPDFLVMNGAFNASARSGGGYIDERQFLWQMNQAVQGIFHRLDGWASHPYPQPNFAGSVNDYGRDSIRAYEWELEILRLNFGVENLPVFITETGWAHAEGKNYNPDFLTEKEVAENIRQAFEKVWLPDEKVVAVTPFTINYPAPFDHFAWVSADGQPFAQYEMVKGLAKMAGQPPYRVVETKIRLDCSES